MARTASFGFAIAILVIGHLYVAQAQSVSVAAAGDVFTGAKAVSGSSKDGKVLGAAVELLASKIEKTLSGLQSKFGPAVKAVKGVKADVLASLLKPLQGTAVDMLNKISAVREASEVSLNSFFGLLLDNTKVLRDTLQDGNAVIDLVRTLRGAECKAAKFDPPAQKPARISGPAGSLKITTGSCTLKRTADPLKVDYTLACVQPGAAFVAQVPRYTSRFVTAAKATTEVCKVERKYGVESETVVTLLNAADLFASAGNSSAADAAASASANATAGGLGVNTAAGWFNTLFPVAGALKTKGKKLEFLPKNVIDAVQKAIKESTVEVTLDYKPFTIKKDMIKSASKVADALSQQFEVQQKLFKVWKDDLAEWADSDKASILEEVNFSGNLRDAMAKYNVSNLFDNAFTKTTSRLMAKTHVGKLASKVAGGLAEQLTSEKPLRTLLSKARSGAGEPVTIKLESGLNQAVSQALDAIKSVSDNSALGNLLAAPKKGSLLELLSKNKGTHSHLKELQKVLDGMGALSTQLGSLRQAVGGAEAGAGAKASADAGAKASADAGAAKASADADAGAAAGTRKEGAADSDADVNASRDAADAVSGGQPSSSKP